MRNNVCSKMRYYTSKGNIRLLYTHCIKVEDGEFAL